MADNNANTPTEYDVDQVEKTNPGPFLSEEEKWELAKSIFPGIVPLESRYGYTNRSVEFRIWVEIEQKYRALLREESPETMDDLMNKTERGAELCVKLGVNEQVARKRFEVIENLRRELDIPCMTSNLNQIWHLVHTFGIISNAYGDPNHIHAGDEHGKSPGVIRTNYKVKNWQSYLGIRLRPGKTREAISVMNDAVEKDQLTDCYVQGTNGKVLQHIDNDEGEVRPSEHRAHKGGIRHDFGPGLYATKGMFLKALAWGIDSCWPLFNYEKNVLQESDEYTLMGHNPAIVAFPNPTQYNSNLRSKIYFDVHDRPPFKDRELKKVMLPSKYEEFSKKKQGYSGSGKDINWKSFLKLARHYNIIPQGDKVFFGRLHNMQRIHQTDQGHEPILDPDTSFIQYCFTSPEDMLGTERLFIEFDIDWNEWLSN